MSKTRPPLVTLEKLCTSFFTDTGEVRAVDDVSLVVPQGRTVGLVGESGSGKSVTALSIIQLLSPPGRIKSGKVTMRVDARRLEGKPKGKKDHGETKSVVLSDLSEPEMRRLRGSQISMIFQEPMSSLNPVFTIGAQIMEAVRLHQDVTRAQAREIAVDMLTKVGVAEPHRRVDEYPHQFSGGMRQRAMIAMALACRPHLLIADEPTTALDVTIQAQILALLKKLQSDLGMSILLITHDLGVIAETADYVVVMYASQVVESASVEDLFAKPMHPYTQGLFASRPRPGMKKTDKLKVIEGVVPSPRAFPVGCKFHPRCGYAQDRCRTEQPALRELAPGHQVRCHFAEQLGTLHEIGLPPSREAAPGAVPSAEAQTAAAAAAAAPGANAPIVPPSAAATETAHDHDDKKKGSGGS